MSSSNNPLRKHDYSYNNFLNFETLLKLITNGMMPIDPPKMARMLFEYAKSVNSLGSDVIGSKDNVIMIDELINNITANI